MDGLLVVVGWLVVVDVELALLVVLLALFRSRRVPKGILIIVAANNHTNCEGMVSADRMPNLFPENQRSFI